MATEEPRLHGDCITIKGVKAGTTTITASYGGKTATASITVSAIAPTLTFTVNSTSLTYNGSAQKLGTVTYNGDGTAYYYISTSNSVPSATASGWTAIANGGAVKYTKAGTYYVHLKATAGTNYTAVNPKLGNSTGKEITKRTVTVTAPVIKTDPIKYTGNNQSLLSGNGSCTTGGQMYYYVSTSATAPTSFSTTSWSTSAPSKKDVGTYYIWYYAYVSDTDNNTGTNINTIKSLGSKEIEKRTGAAPTFNSDSVSATCVQSATTVNAGAFGAATAGHSGSITYSITGVVKDGTTTQLTGWTMTSNTSRVIKVPASTKPGTYKVTVRATEGTTTTDTSSHTDAVITVTLSKGAQSLTLTSNPTNASTTYPTGGTITASGHSGAISASSATTGVATVSTSNSTVTVTAKGYGTSEITVTAAATDYVNAVSKKVTWSVARRAGAAPTFNNSTVSATCSQDQTAKTTSAFTAATAGHSGSITYSLVSAKNSGGTALSNWTVNSSNRTIGIPANTKAGTYTVVVKATEAQTSTDTSSTKDATITVNLGRGTQTLNLTSSPTNASTTYPTGGTITASGHVGSISASSATTSVATVSASGSEVTVSAVGYGTSVITVTAAQTDYVNAVNKTVTWSVARRTGAAPTFNNDSVNATCVQSATAVNAGAFDAATAGHSGSITYSLISAKNSSGTTLSGWTMTSSTSRVITVPASTKPGTYTIVVRATEAQTSTDSSSTKDATITVTLSKGSQTLNLDKTSLSLTVPNTGTIKASGYAGTLSVSSNKTGVATASNAATSTITAVGVGDTTSATGSATITFTAAATDYVNSATKTATVTVSRRTGAAPTFSASSVTATCVQAQSARTTSAFTAGTAKHSGSLSYSFVSAANSNGDSLAGWSVNSSNRTIGIPANTKAGTYTVVVKCTESQTSSDTASSTNATITVTLNKGSQTLNLDKTSLEITVPNTGTITASGYVGTLTVTSGTTSVATATNEAASTITAKTAGTSTITFTATANDYVNSVTKTATVTVNRRTGAAPTFNNDSVSATCSQNQSAKTTSAFDAATAGHGGTISYTFVSAKNSSGTTLSGWTVNSSDRTIGIPANTKAGTYTVVVRANEAQTSTDTSSTKDATITVNLGRGAQTLTLDKTELNLTVPDTGTIKATGYAGTLTVSSGTTTVATATNSATSTITAVSYGSSTITFTAGQTDYVNSVTKTATVNVSRRTGAAPTFNDSSVTATCVQAQSARTTTAFTAATAGHSGTISYTLVSAKNSDGDTLTGWSVNSSNRTIGIPANTKAGTYTVVVKANEAQTSTDTASSANATITVTLSKGSQSLTLTGNPTNFTSTYNSGGTITASGHVGSISASSSDTSVATVSVSGSKVTVTCKKAGTATITVTAAANDYVNAVSKTQVWTINKANATACTTWEGDSKGYDEAQTTPASLTYSGYSGGTIKFRYDTDGGTNYGSATTTAPTRNTVGTTSVQYMIEGDANHNSTGWSEAVTLTVNAETDAHMTVTLTARTYSGSAQVIATGGSLHAVASYKIGYIRKDIGTSAPSSPTADSQLTWGSNNSSLSATNAGDYYVYYTMTPGTGHTNSKTREYVGKVTISKASRSGAVSFKSGSTTVTRTTYPNTVNAVVSGNIETGTITWSVTNGTTGKATVNSSGVVTPTQAGKVTVNATVAATANYNAYTATSAELTIDKAAGTITYSTVSSVQVYCRTDAVPADTAYGDKELTIATASASGATGTVSYSISQSGWSISSDGKTITVPSGTAAGTYNITVSATSAESTNYLAKTVTNSITVKVLAQELVRIELSLADDTISFNDTTTATVIAVYTTGITADVTSNSGTSYSSDPTGIVTITK